MTFHEYLATKATCEDDVGDLARLVAEQAEELPISKSGTVTSKDLKRALSTLHKPTLFAAVDVAFAGWEVAKQAEADAERLQADAEAEQAKEQAEQEQAQAQAKAQAQRAAKVAPDARVNKLKAQAEADRKRQDAIYAEQAEREADAARQVAAAEQEAAEGGKAKRKGLKVTA